MSAAIQLKFNLRTTPGVKTVHLLGSWDNYQNQLPMSQDSSKSSSGAWVGAFRFQPGTLKQGTRYWYYYIMDGIHVTHDPAIPSVVEPTTQRKLNILDIPASSKSSSGSTSSRSKRQSRRVSVDVPKGRSLSPSEIRSPKPYKPGQAKKIVAFEHEQINTLAALEEQFTRTSLSDSEEDDSEDDSDDSDDSSNVPSLTSSRTSNSSSPSSLSSGSNSSQCSCERYGITRSGNRVKLDCGGKRCGYDDSDDCSSEEEEAVYHAKATRRHGVVVRGQ